MSSRRLDRLFRPKSLAVIGGGAWCRQVIGRTKSLGFSGAVYPIHPTATEIEGFRAYSSISALPDAPDAAFIGINRHSTIDAVAGLNTIGAGGAICFASGFAEAMAEDVSAASLQADLLSAAGHMPILGPNCYGFINALDGAMLWPDQHGLIREDTGVAIITQSSNIALNITMQSRALPVAYIVTAGNQAQITQADIAAALLNDPRVTAIGLHIEGFSDLRAWEALAAKANAQGTPLVALKVGKSDQAQAATVTHTASLAGSDAGADALLCRLGIARVHSLPTFLETLKLLHVTGRLPSNRIASISCSGGEAALVADSAVSRNLTFPPLNDTQRAGLAAALGPMVGLANPLDYHTYIWRDAGAMTAAWSAMMDPSLALTLLVVDFPRGDRCDMSDWDSAIEAAIAAKAQTGANVAMVASLPELMPEEVALTLRQNGVVPLCGLDEALAAAAAAASISKPNPQPLFLTDAPSNPVIIGEATAKARLATFGADVPPHAIADSIADVAMAASTLRFPVALKALGLAHKSEHGAVTLNLRTPEAVTTAAKTMPGERFLIEEMVQDPITELLVGITRDPAHGFLLTIGAGGTLTEILQDSVTLLLPVDAASIEHALTQLKIAPILGGYRGQPPIDIAATCTAILAIQSYVLANGDAVEELEVNPLILTPTRAVIADALLRESP
ncbi:acetate--CoA ligase family protein [Aliiroseovarius sp. YM-037]|uniref:acetate--CoA ligase family protein n=1 Tax=Aliiroseovarius sp. YM-037 TaxID=3341728 RepID=UPI003A807F3D